jgi:hypothetical protein
MDCDFAPSASRGYLDHSPIGVSVARVRLRLASSVSGTTSVPKAREQGGEYGLNDQASDGCKTDEDGTRREHRSVEADADGNRPWRRSGRQHTHGASQRHG